MSKGASTIATDTARAGADCTIQDPFIRVACRHYQGEHPGACRVQVRGLDKTGVGKFTAKPEHLEGCSRAQEVLKRAQAEAQAKGAGISRESER